MADPVTIGMMAVGTGISLFGASQQADAAEQAGEARYQEMMYRAAIAERNTEIAEQNADYEFWVGEHEAQRVGLAGAERLGMIRAAQGASGLDVGFGSNVRVQESQQMVNTHDVATTRANAARRAYGHMIEAESATASGQLARMGATSAREAASNNAASSLLSGASSVSGRWLQASQTGMFGGGGGRNPVNVYGAAGSYGVPTYGA